jgi:BirA family biotin operon repressor/biotin-[acetyl-CoA-carboxylase] ligase
VISGAAAPADPSFAWRLRIHDVLGSTQEVAVAAAEAGEAEGLAVMARRQSAGRGREGRSWASPAGNLHLSVLLRPRGAVRDAPQWALLAGVALAEAIQPLLPDPAELRLKWPNDLLRGEGKLAGILSEAAAAPDGSLAWLVLGIGVNLATAPALPDRPSACLADLGPPAPEAFAARLLASLANWRARHRAEGFAPVRAAWLARGPAPDSPLVLRGAEGPIHGRFAGLGEDGSLRLATATGVRAVVAGEGP